MYPSLPPSRLSGGGTCARRSGARLMPQLPTTTVVTPVLIFGSICVCSITIRSSCVWTSMKPGATMQPLASMTAAPAVGRSASMATIRSPSTHTSAVRRGAPVPSITVPPRKSIVMSEERPNCTGDPIIVSDRQQQPPFVERRARMRDPAAHQITNLEIGIFRNPEMSVLIIHRGDFPLRGRGLRSVAATAKVPLEDRKVEVERRIAFAHCQQGEPGLWPRLDLRPYLQRGL